MHALRYASIAALLALASTARADGRLDGARDAISGSNASSGSSDRRERREDDDCGLLCAVLGALFEDDDDDGDESEHARPDPDRPLPYGSEPAGTLRPEFGYARFPYARADAHYLVPRETLLAAFSGGEHGSDVSISTMPRPPRSWAGQLMLDAGHLEGATRSGISGRVLLPDGFELDARYGAMFESTDRDGIEHASTGTAHVSYRVLGAHLLMLRLGAGLRYWADAELGAAGVDLQVGLDVFPVKPLVVSAHLAGGSLGEAFATDARVQLGLAFHRFEVFAGFEWMRIDDVDLNMPVLGTRLWL